MKFKIYRIPLPLLFLMINNFAYTNSLARITTKCMTERDVCQENSVEHGLQFYLFTSRNKENPEALHKCDSKLPHNTYFNNSNPIEIIIHGYLEGVCTHAWIREMKDELLKRQDYNVIIVDWAQYVLLDYLAPIIKIKGELSKITTTLIDNIKEQQRINYTKIHLIGHSLGAHFAAFIGQRTKVYRITALDPAGPGFYDKSIDEKLDRNDADFVDAIHTNGGRCLPFFGYKYPLADEDFYVEGGRIQISCYHMVIESFLKLDMVNALQSLLLPTTCFHKQSVQYFKSSINAHQNCCFLGKRCPNYKDAVRKSGKCAENCGKSQENCSIMGMDWPLTYKRKLRKQRVYKVDVKNTCPYCTQCIPEKSIFNISRIG